MFDGNTESEKLLRLLAELKMNVPAISTPHIEDRTMRDDGNPLIAKLAAQRTRGERMLPPPIEAPDTEIESVRKWSNDVDDTIDEGRRMDYGFLDGLMEEMAREMRKLRGYE